MKKSSIVFGAVIILGAAWTGSAWYTGKNIETYLEQRVEMINHHLANLGTETSNIKFDHVKIERGIFSSQIHYDVVATLPDNTLTIPFEGTMYHGPFPLNRLRQFNFAPVLLSSQDSVVKNAQTQAWFDYAQGKNPMLNTFTLDYDYTVSGRSELAAIQLPLDDANILWKGGVLNFDNVTDKGEGLFEGVIDDFQVNVNATAHNAAMSLSSEKIKFENNLQASNWENILLGKQKIQFDQLRFSQEAKKSNPALNMLYKNLVFEGETLKNGEFIDYKTKINLPEAWLNNTKLGKLEIGLDLTHLEANTLNALLALIEKNEVSEDASQQLYALLTKLAEHSAAVSIKPLTITTDAGDVKADALIEMANANFDVLKEGKTLSLFKQLNANVDLNKVALKELLVNLEHATSGKNKEQVMAQTTLLVDHFIRDLTRNGVFVDNGDHATLKLILENGELKLNGYVIPEAQILMSLLLLGVGS
ncbi:YdgA family protein [Pasteurella sp. PK-2025]|uniref:YdgA family protein n=1 Tax=unclassified Pasteurella TaxID=2621516 RepID=UPI003C77FA42